MNRRKKFLRLNFKSKVIHFAAVLFILFSFTALQALDVPLLKGRVNDYASMFSNEALSRIETKLKALEDTDSTQVVVLTINTLNGDVLEDFSMRVAESWKIGQAGKDNGVILLIVKNDNRLRIEVGYGLEGVLTDAVCGRIIDSIMVPNFRAGNFDAGIENAIDAIVTIVNGEFVSGINKTPDIGDQLDNKPGEMIVTFLVFFLFVRALTQKKKGVFKGKVGLGLISGLITSIALRESSFGLGSLNISWLLYLLCGSGLGMLISLIPGESRIVKILVGMFVGSGGRSGGGYGGSGGGGFSGGGGSFGGGGASGRW